MINKQMLTILAVITLLSPLVSNAACLDNNGPAKNRITGDCHYKTQYYLAGLAEQKAQQPASTQKTGDQPGSSAIKVAESSNASSKGHLKQTPKSSEPDLDHFDWIPRDWYEVY
jgi:hypothetical protein